MRRRKLAFGCLIAGGALALIASAQPWWRGPGDGAALRLTGNQATGELSQALAIVALAGTLLMLVLRTRGRRLVSVMLLLVGFGVALVGGFGLEPRHDVVRRELGQVSLTDTVGLTPTAWPWIFAFAGVMIAGGAALIMITAGSWPVASGRFQPRPDKTLSDDSAELWKAMDAGVDPTTVASVGNHAPDDRRSDERTGFSYAMSDDDVEFPARDARAAENNVDHDTLRAPDPKMRDGEAGDTMDGTEQAQPLPWSPTSHSTGQVQRGPREREV